MSMYFINKLTIRQPEVGPEMRCDNGIFRTTEKSQGRGVCARQQVADALGLTASTYCGYETGKRQPDVAETEAAGPDSEHYRQLSSGDRACQNTCRPLGLAMTSWPLWQAQ